MKSVVVGIGMVAVAAALGLASCGGDPATTGTTVIDIGATSFVTIPPVPVTVAPVTSAVAIPGSIIEYDTPYVVAADDYPSTVANRYGITLDEFLAANDVTLDDNGFWPGWTAGLEVTIPAGATVPGEPPITAAPTTVPGSETTAAAASESTTATTEAPASVTTTTAVPTGACAPGSYTIEEGDYPGKVAQKFDVSVGALNTANANTKYYSSFAVGVKIVIPAPSDCAD